MVAAVKPELIWLPEADQRLADNFEDIAVRYRALPEPRPDVTTGPWQLYMEMISTAYRHWDPAEFNGALAAFHSRAADQLNLCGGGSGHDAKPAPPGMPGLSLPDDGSPCPGCGSTIRRTAPTTAGQATFCPVCNKTAKSNS